MTSDGQRQGENVRWVGISLGIVVSLRFLELTAVHSREMGQREERDTSSLSSPSCRCTFPLHQPFRWTRE